MSLMPKTPAQIEHERNVQQASMDVAVELLKVTVGSMLDDLKTLRLQLLNLHHGRAPADVLSVNAAAVRGQKLYREAVDKLWADLPFRCADIVTSLDKNNELANPEYVAGAVAHFVRSAKPYWFDVEEVASCNSIEKQ